MITRHRLSPIGAALLLISALTGTSRADHPNPSTTDAIHAGDELYGRGQDAAHIRDALAVLERALAADPGSYDLLWRMSRALYQLADAAAREDKRPLLDRAIEMGERATAAAPGRVEGHYWLGASEGGAAEIRGAFKALSLVSKLRDEMESVIRIAPCYEGGDAFRALGELDMQLPWIVGGKKSRAVRRMEEGIHSCPSNLELELSLARAYLETGRKEDGRRLLEQIAREPSDPTHPDADREVRERAAKRLAALR